MRYGSGSGAVYKVVTTSTNRSSGLRAEFFDLPAGTPALPDLAGRVADVDRVDARLAYAPTDAPWHGLDGRFADTFAARHTGYLRVEAAGEYTLYLDSDDGSRLWLDGELLIDNDGLHPMAERSVTRTLAAGDHALRVEYFENAYGAGLLLSWSGPGPGEGAGPRRQPAPRRRAATAAAPPRRRAGRRACGRSSSTCPPARPPCPTSPAASPTSTASTPGSPTPPPTPPGTASTAASPTPSPPATPATSASRPPASTPSTWTATTGRGSGSTASC